MQEMRYNPTTGLLWRGGKDEPENRMVRHNNYISHSVDGRIFPAHRIIWFKVTGEWPSPWLVIDHINGVKYDNRIENLRLVTTKENCNNRHKSPRIELLVGLFKSLGVKLKYVCASDDHYMSFTALYDTQRIEVKFGIRNDTIDSIIIGEEVT